MSNDFSFVVPVDVYKSDENGEWRIKGLASTEDIDSQNEVIIQRGLDISHLKEGLGLFNYDHSNKPEDIIGQITDANQTQEGLFVEGYLFKEQPRAQALKNILKSLQKGSEKRLKMSIEGKVLSRKGNKIEKAKIMNVALTLNPINGQTYAQFAKSFSNECPPQSEDAESVAQSPSTALSVSNLERSIFDLELKIDSLFDVVKAISAPSEPVAPKDKVQGDALASESLDRDKKQLCEYTDKILKMYPKMDYKTAAKAAFVALKKQKK